MVGRTRIWGHLREFAGHIVSFSANIAVVRTIRDIFLPLATICCGLAITACSSTIEGKQDGVDSGFVQSQDAASVLIPDAEPPQPCVEGEARMEGGDGTCYMLFYLAPQDWSGAQAQCLGVSATLTVVSDAAEQSIVASLAGQVPVITPDAWLGANDQVTENTFLWVDGTPVVYDNWRVDEPNDGNSAQATEDCVVIEGDLPASTWDDRGCDSINPFICERN